MAPSVELENYLKEIEAIQEEFLKNNPEYIEFEPPIEPGDYECISYMFGIPSKNTLYCDGYDFKFFFDNGSWCYEKVSHYIPNESGLE